MEAQGQRVEEGFPGYRALTLPRATRSSRGRGDATAQRQSSFGGSSGFFELLATVAGQFLQDVGEEQQDGVKLGDQVILNGNQSPDIDFHVADIVESSQTHTVQGEVTLMPVCPTASTLDALEKASGKDADLQVVHVTGQDIKCTDVSNGFETGTHRAVLLQEEKRVVSVKDHHVDEDNRSVQGLSTQKAQPVSEDNESVSKRNASPGSPLMAFPVYRSDSITPLEGEIIKMEWYPSNQIQESLSTKEMVCQQIVEDKKLTALVSVDMDILQPVCEKKGLTELTRQNVGSADNLAGSFECSESLGELKAGQDSEQEAETRSVVEQTGNPGMDLKCNTNMQDGNVVKAEKAIDLAKGREEEYISMGMEDKCMIVDSKNCCPEVTSNSCRLGTQGAVEVESTMAMLKKTVPKRECRVIRNKIKEHRSSQHLLPESMVKIAKDAYSKVRKARKAAKVVKRNCVFGTRSKRKHTDMDLTDNSHSSEEAIFEGNGLFGGIASFTRQRTTRGLPAKRKRMLDGSAKPSAELHVNTNNLMEMGYEFVDGKPLAATAKLRSAKAKSVVSSPTAKGTPKLSSKMLTEPQVKLSIKSFTVPELFVDLPETATVSSLKRAVMDAAMNLLGGGLHVRVLMQGKKVPDEAATLSQMGISCSTKPESLGFMLEPSPVPTSPSGTSEDPLLVLSRAVKHPSPWYPVFGVRGLSGSDDAGGQYPGKGQSNKANGTTEVSNAPPKLPGAKPGIKGKLAHFGLSVTIDDPLKGCNGSKTKAHLNEQMSISPQSTQVPSAGALAAIRAQADANRRAKNELEIPSPLPNLTYDNIEGDPGAMILHPTVGTGDFPGMSLVPMQPKSSPLDIGKRRVRRPFSVTEVEALVHAVEKLGIGRWRDVKLRAFNQAKHRTYVDLKDKWKTLVHTARIAPHQRRGEPVPQELLERVTRAHTFWSVQEGK